MLPAHILAKGDLVALEYLLETSALGGFFQREDVRRALAQDIILEQFKPFVFTALFIDDEAIAAAWRLQRPEGSSLARRLATHELGAYEKLPRQAYDLRLRLRLSAYRKIDVWWCGHELFVPEPSLGAEPYFTIQLPGYDATPVKIGHSRSSTYNSDPKRDAAALELMQQEPILLAIERALYPLLPVPSASAPEEWQNLQSVLAVAANFAHFSHTHKLPAFPKALIVDPSAIPVGFQARFPLEASLWGTLYALGISPILSDPAVDYLHNKQRSIRQTMDDRAALLTHLARSIHFDKVG